ncbi:hypothetical protein SERLADRAFT_472869 [Serpula lacrymans var. lacrymans S7.9]|uniref:F-box domain-containing protein n=1 Tax=Serpula lacrymans var. lacrymans (strain S7.9) TaxID=578457 RepID=F8P432_SERL9|nr:uncharacterized protein SERLADRAFT_472869 [Serpula lacrymans var. lacrymans S7.9]EGO22280.1 hypothetical protein SERLADRAFT_472869 [Serpula lacrymans var. lacrymans S7.9]
MPVLSDIPVEVLIDNVLPFFSISDIVHLGSTNRFFASLCNDDTFWKRRLQADFNFSDEKTARTTGWKLIYKGLSNPRVFVWGESSKGRLGITQFPRSVVKDVPFPTELRFSPGVRIVSLSAGGMSFHALDSRGNVHVWGTLDGTSVALQQDGFSVPAKSTPTPLKLAMPAATHSISCGRLHATTLDDNSYIWTFLSWGRPFRLVTALLDNTSVDSTPLQIESGWQFSSVLTKSGDVLVWWPFGTETGRLIAERNTAMDEARDLSNRAHPTADGVIHCTTWELHKDPLRLPSLPRLPQLDDVTRSAVSGEDTKLVKIAAMDHCLIGLTNHGHVLKFNVGDETNEIRGEWVYLPNFSEVGRIQQHPTFSPEDGTRLDIPQTTRITHISAQYKTFIAYSTGSSSIVLMGSNETNYESQPLITSSLQNRNVISVVLGDYHFGALTSSGNFLTWGAYSRGALGLGDPAHITPGEPGGYRTEERRAIAQTHGGPFPPDVREPTEVRFDHGEKQRKERYCFAATCAGWHSGALVIDLEVWDLTSQLLIKVPLIKMFMNGN